MTKFSREIEGYATADLILIFTDQKDLYSADELTVIEAELLARPEITGKKPYPRQPETLFKSAPSSKLSGLLRAIRRAGEDGNYKKAVEYCRLAIAEDPNCWEAIFYLACYDPLQGRTADLPAGTANLCQKIHTILHLIWESDMDTNATKRALAEVYTKLSTLVDSLYNLCIARYNKYINPLHTAYVKSQIVEETQQQVGNLYAVAFEFGDCLCQMFGNRVDLVPVIRNAACASWKHGIRMQAQWASGFEKLYFAKLMQQYIDKIRIFEPCYQPPKIRKKLF